jgi:hypothetical protein
MRAPAVAAGIVPPSRAGVALGGGVGNGGVDCRAQPMPHVSHSVDT